LGIQFPERAASAGAPGLSVAFSHLLGAVTVSKNTITDWLASWQDALAVVQKDSGSLPILAQKKTYYQAAIESSLNSAQPSDSIWPLIVTWTEAVNHVPNHPQLLPPWIKAITILGFAGKDYQNRLAAFDSFLETCESLILRESEGSDLGTF
jgi:hypothetical protein